MLPSRGILFVLASLTALSCASSYNKGMGVQEVPNCEAIRADIESKYQLPSTSAGQYVGNWKNLAGEQNPVLVEELPQARVRLSFLNNDPNPPHTLIATAIYEGAALEDAFYAVTNMQGNVGMAKFDNGGGTLKGMVLFKGSCNAATFSLVRSN